MTAVASTDAGWADYRPPFRISRHHEAGIWLIAIAGELDIATSPQLQAHLHGAAESEGAILIDLCAVEFIDSTAVRSLWEGHHYITGHGRHFAVACGQDSAPRQILILTGLISLIEHYDDRASAIVALAPAA